MLTIRASDQVCTSLRHARKSLEGGRSTPGPRMGELDLIIGELAVGAPSYVGNAEKTKGEVEALVALLSQLPRSASVADTAGEADPAADADLQGRLPPGVDDALAHCRRAIATLQRFIAAEGSPPQ